MLLSTSKRRSPSELALALADLNWTRATDLLRSGKGAKLASRWSTLQGFFEGLKDAQVLPLHQASAVAQVPVDVVQLLLQTYPAAVQETESSYQRLPLHCACRTAADPLVVRLLLQADWDFAGRQQDSPVTPACLQPDVLGRLPLHYALSNGAHPETIRALLQAAPQSAQGVDARGWTPLHVACSTGCSLTILQQLYAAYPPAICMSTVQGSSPARCLHKQAPNRWQLKDFLKRAKLEYESNEKLPCLTRRPQCPEQQGRGIDRTASSPAVFQRHAAPSASRGITRSASHDGTAVPSIAPRIPGEEEQMSRRMGLERSASHDGIPLHPEPAAETPRRSVSDDGILQLNPFDAHHSPRVSQSVPEPPTDVTYMTPDSHNESMTHSQVNHPPRRGGRRPNPRPLPIQAAVMC